MTISLYELTIPVFIKHLQTLSKLLEKGEKHTQSAELNKNGLTVEKLVGARLIDDMGDLVYQIQRISDTSKGLATRIGKAPSIPLPDTETTLTDLHSRISKTISILESVRETDMADAETREVVMPTAKGPVSFNGKSYALEFAVPNFYFHFVMAYALLRMEGVGVGKQNFLGRGF